MGKLSDDEKKALADLTAKAEAPDDEEVWVEYDGVKTQLKGERANKFLSRFSKALGIEDETTEGEGGDEDKKDKEPSSTSKYFK